MSLKKIYDFILDYIMEEEGYAVKLDEIEISVHMGGNQLDYYSSGPIDAVFYDSDEKVYYFQDMYIPDLYYKV